LARRLPRLRTIVVGLAIASLAVILIVVIGNVRGWRALVTSRVFRVEHYPTVAPAPGFRPSAPPGFEVSLFATDFADPRWLAVAPNGDLFVADSDAGRVVVLRSRPGAPAAESRQVFVDGLTLPFGVAFNAEYVYVANTNAVVRFRYDPATSARRGEAEHIMELPGLGYNQHWTRSLAFSQDKRQLFVSVGSRTNVGIEEDVRRAAVLVTDPDGKHWRVFASGLRNAVGLAIHPDTGELWATVNERDNIGDDVPADYFTRVRDGGFYGWPYSYWGSHVDNRVPARPDLVSRALIPDVSLGAHVAPLQAAFYTGNQFPASYRGGVFIAEHGSWNRRERSGYQVVFVPFSGNSPSGPPTPFLSGFVVNPSGAEVNGRVVGVAVAADGSLLVSDDGSRVIWRIAYDGRS
jgi:glucose/arabinose dehydrogenase